MKNQVIQGDCLEVMKGMPDKSVDMILCDLPYGTTACKWDTIIPFEPLWGHYKRIIKDNGAIVLTASQPFTSALVMSNPKMFKYEWIWEKNNASNFQLVNYQPLKTHEQILIFIKDVPDMPFAKIMSENMGRLGLKQTDVSKLELSRSGGMTGWVTNKLNGSQLPTAKQWDKICKLFGIKNEYEKILLTVSKPTFNLTLDSTKITLSNKNKGGRLGHLSSEKKRNSYLQTKTGYPKTVLRYKRETGFHPTQKPVALFEYLIKTYTNEGDLVLDNCAGSGTTGVACKNLNRNYILIEKEQEYIDIINKRLANTQ